MPRDGIKTRKDLGLGHFLGYVTQGSYIICLSIIPSSLLPFNFEGDYNWVLLESCDPNKFYGGAIRDTSTRCTNKFLIGLQGLDLREFIMWASYLVLGRRSNWVLCMYFSWLLL